MFSVRLSISYGVSDTSPDYIEPNYSSHYSFAHGASNHEEPNNVSHCGAVR